MKRRELIIGGAGLGAVLGGGAIAYWRLGADAEPDAGDDDPRESDGESVPPFELRTIAPDADGTATLPAFDRVCVANFARTACPTTREHVSELADARERLAADGIDEDSVGFLTVVRRTGDPAETDAEYATWWNDTDGDWTLAFDETGVAFDHYDVVSLPTTVFLDADGDERARSEGPTSAGTVADRVRAALGE